MTGLLKGAGEPDAQPFCRQAELTDIISAIRQEDCSAVFLTSDSGLGASTILRKLQAEAMAYVPVLTVHGSRSLAKLPYGVLAPYVTWHDLPAEAFRLGVLRQVLAAIDQKQVELGREANGNQDRALLVVDDAHAIDDGTAELLVTLVQSGAANLVASHSHRHKLPEPLRRLWAKGLAENIVLLPLKQEQGHDFCEALLNGPVLPATSWHFWSMSAGNPLFLQLLVSEALAQGRLDKHGDTWVAEHAPHTHSRGLEDAVTVVLHELSPGGKAALELVALAEPLDEDTLRSLVPSDAIRELLDWPLIGYQTGSSKLLRLANPIYGQAIREMIPISQSRVLHQQLIGDLRDNAPNKESVLRRVLWALEVGIAVDNETLLRSAVLATKIFQSVTALELANQIHEPEFMLRATMVKARAKYNLGDYRGAFRLMETMGQDAGTVQDLLYGSLLRASTRSALGMPVRLLLADAQDLRDAGEKLALADPQQTEFIRAHAQSSALVVELMALSRAGRYSEMTALTELLANQKGLPTAADRLNRTMALTMDSERLTAQGFPEQGIQRSVEAFAIEHSEENDVFFLPESIMLRQLTAMLCAGHWAEASGVMDQFSLEDGPIVFSFGGGASIVRGLGLLRAGSYSDALSALTAGLDPLRLSDPQQLLGFCTAMAAYCAARLGKKDLASELLDEHVDSTGMFVVLSHERAFLAATRYLVRPDGGGLAELVAQADDLHSCGVRLSELNALALALELGEESLAARVAEVANCVEGPWAKGVGLYATALVGNDTAGMREAGEYLKSSGAHGLAERAHAKLQWMLTGVEAKTKELVAAAPYVVEPVGGDVRLTRRESEIARMAATGKTDKVIAENLKVSPRTVQGHLSNVYSKLGIRGRVELSVRGKEL